jgi:hypothetical protein
MLREYEFSQIQGVFRISFFMFRHSPNDYIAHGPDAPLQYGLIAEEVAEVAPELVARKRDGEVETVYYDKVNALLLDQVQTQQRQIESQKEQLESQREQFTALISHLESRLTELESRAK